MFRLCEERWNDAYFEAPSRPRLRIFTNSLRLRDLFAVSTVSRERHLLDANVTLLAHALHI